MIILMPPGGGGYWTGSFWKDFALPVAIGLALGVGLVHLWRIFGA